MNWKFFGHSLNLVGIIIFCLDFIVGLIFADRIKLGIVHNSFGVIWAYSMYVSLILVTIGFFWSLIAYFIEKDPKIRSAIGKRFLINVVSLLVIGLIVTFFMNIML